MPELSQDDGAGKIQPPFGKLIHFRCEMLPERYRCFFHDVKLQMPRTAVNRTLGAQPGLKETILFQGKRK